MDSNTMIRGIDDRTTSADEELPVHVLAVSDVYTSLATSPLGLRDAEAAQRLQRDGPNVIQEIRRTPLLVKLLANFTHLMAILLWVGGLVALVAKLPQLALAIWLVNVINGAFSFWQEYKAEKAIEALRRLLPNYARARRNGEERRILATELVRGDVLLLAEGDHISADARIVQETELRVDQSTLTGESHPVRKFSDPVHQRGQTRVELSNLVFSGTTAVAGTGTAVVIATGMATEFGKIARLTQTVGEDASPLQKELVQVTRLITVIAVGIGLIFFALAALLAGVDLAESFIFAMGMIVAFVPEGLLPTVTLALAMGVQRMARRHALIKRLSAVETLGSTTVICTDKTGTLTQNEMTVRHLWVAGRPLTVTGVGYAPVGRILDDAAPVAEQEDGDVRQLLTAAALCTNARLLPPGEGSPGWSVLGDPTEAALVVAALKGGLDLPSAARDLPRLRELPFESRRKRMTTIHQTRTERVAYVKGAPKELMALSTHLWWNGTRQAFSDDLREQVAAAIDGYARNGLRVLAVAMRVLPESLPLGTPDGVERELTFLGLAAMLDPPRPEVFEAVQKCFRAGIRVVMITGDYGLTAESIARRIGIIRTTGPRIITGGELDAMDDVALREALQDEVIFARVAPEHKLRVVTMLQQMGHVVAVTGDGVNDAPALKKADLGVAMGIAGTDVAKEAADMILTDDNFASIVNAVEEGRAVYVNIKKFTTYIFTSNTPEAVPFILFAFSRGRIPLALNVMHILSIDLGTDIVPALALSAEPPEPGLMDRPPRAPTAHIITGPLLRRAYLWLGPVQSLAAMAAFYFLYWTNGYAGRWVDLPSGGTLYHAATGMALAAVVATQIGNLFAQRTERTSFFRIGPFGNRLLWFGIATELMLVVLIIYVPIVQHLIGTAAFPLRDWLFLFAWTPSLLLVDEVRKALMRRRERPAAVR